MRDEEFHGGEDVMTAEEQAHHGYTDEELEDDCIHVLNQNDIPAFAIG